MTPKPRLYFLSAEIDLSTCPFFCELIQQVGLGLERFDSGLAYSADTGMLHLVGSQLALAPLGPRTLYDIVDPSTFVTIPETIQVDAFTTGAIGEPGARTSPRQSPRALCSSENRSRIKLAPLRTGPTRARAAIMRDGRARVGAV